MSIESERILQEDERALGEERAGNGGGFGGQRCQRWTGTGQADEVVGGRSPGGGAHPKYLKECPRYTMEITPLMNKRKNPRTRFQKSRQMKTERKDFFL